MDRAFVLHKRGLRQFKGIWDMGRLDFMQWRKYESSFPLFKVSKDFGLNWLPINVSKVKMLREERNSLM